MLLEQVGAVLELQDFQWESSQEAIRCHEDGVGSSEVAGQRFPEHLAELCRHGRVRILLPGFAGTDPTPGDELLQESPHCSLDILRGTQVDARRLLPARPHHPGREPLPLVLARLLDLFSHSPGGSAVAVDEEVEERGAFREGCAELADTWKGSDVIPRGVKRQLSLQPSALRDQLSDVVIPCRKILDLPRIEHPRQL